MDPGEIGEIYVKSPNLFLGYAGRPEETRETFDVHGWLKTGDLGYFTADGEIFIVDRKKEMIKYMSYQVAPSEIEACIMKIEGVKGVCVVGIPDILAGDLAAAVIVKEGNSFLTEQDIVDEVASKFKVVSVRILKNSSVKLLIILIIKYEKLEKNLHEKSASHKFRIFFSKLLLELSELEG